MTKSPAFQFYPDKWSPETKRLSWKAKGLFYELSSVVWQQYQDTCSIPDDDDFIASELGCTTAEWLEAKAEIMNPLRPLLTKQTNRLVFPLLLEQAVKQVERRERLRENGMKGGRPKNQLVRDNQEVIADKPDGFEKETKKKAGSENQNERLPSLSPSLSPIKSNLSITGTPTLEEVKTRAGFIGQTPDDAELFWHHFEAMGWIDKNGHQIVNWHSKQQVWKTTTAANNHQKKGQSASNGAVLVMKNQEYIRVCDEIRKINNGAAGDAMGSKFYTPAEKERLKEFRNRRDALKKELGITL
jgi:hypothetical protein